MLPWKANNRSGKKKVAGKEDEEEDEEDERKEDEEEEDKIEEEEEEEIEIETIEEEEEVGVEKVVEVEEEDEEEEVIQQKFRTWKSVTLEGDPASANHVGGQPGVRQSQQAGTRPVAEAVVGVVVVSVSDPPTVSRSVLNSDDQEHTIDDAAMEASLPEEDIHIARRTRTRGGDSPSEESSGAGSQLEGSDEPQQHQRQVPITGGERALSANHRTGASSVSQSQVSIIERRMFITSDHHQA